MDPTPFIERIRQKRIELCYPGSGEPPADDEVVRQMLTLLQNLPPELQLVVLKHADPVAFAILRTGIPHDNELYCTQLSKLLHHSRFAQALQGKPTEARETYERVLMARQCVLNSIKYGIFPLRTRHEIVKWEFAEDYGLMYTIEEYVPQITVWKLCGNTVENVWTRGGVIDAVFSACGQQVLVSGSDGVVEVWDFADSPEMVTSEQLDGFHNLFTSDTYLFTTGVTGPTLWKWESSSLLARIQLPYSMTYAQLAAFLPETHRVVFSHESDLWLADLPPQEGPPRAMPRDMTKPVICLLWSANNGKIVAVSPKYIELWNVDSIEAQPMRYDVKGEDEIASAALSPDGMFLAFGRTWEIAGESTLHVLDISKDSPSEVYHGYPGFGTGLAWFLDRHLAFAGRIIDIGEHIQREM